MNASAPSSSSAGTVITLRVVFIAVTVLSCGLLAWVAMLRVAITRRRPLDWVLLWTVVVVTLTGFAVVGSVPETDVWSDVGLAAVLIMVPAVSVHYLVQDLAHHQRTLPGPVPLGYAPPPAYPYVPQSTTLNSYNPYRDTIGPGVPQTPPPGQTPPPARTSPAPMPPRTAPPQRIDQVRAELDELSDYLRKEEGR